MFTSSSASLEILHVLMIAINRVNVCQECLQQTEESKRVQNICGLPFADCVLF